MKPENVMVVSDPQVAGGERTKLLDFGIAKLIGDIANPQVRTKTGDVFGTPTYMSPEQCAGASRVDAQSDVYSLGCVLYELLSGKPPFDGKSTAHLLTQHLKQAPTALFQNNRDIPESFSSLIQRMLDKERDARPAMAKVAKALQALSDGNTGPTGFADWRAFLGGTRSRALVTALGLAVLFLSATIALHRLKKKSPPPASVTTQPIAQPPPVAAAPIAAPAPETPPEAKPEKRPASRASSSTRRHKSQQKSRRSQ